MTGIVEAEVLGRRIAHRGSVADQGVLRQVFTDWDYDLARFRRNADIDAFYRGCPSPLVVDAGANIGASTVYFASRYPKAEVLAVEPEADNFGLLQRNVAGLDVRPVQGAIAGGSGTVQLVDPGEGEWGYRTAGEGTPLAEVRAFSLSELLALAPERTPFILKLDIEGAEGDLFADEPEVFARFPVVIVELHDWLLPRGGTSRPFLQWHAARDRDFVHRGENIFSFCNRLLPAPD